MNLTCAHFKDCGGCSLRDVEYQTQLELKKTSFIKLFHDNSLFELLPNNIEIIPSKKIDYYRNKMEFSFANGAIGLHKKGQFNKIVNITNCLLQTETTNKILEIIRLWVNEINIPVYDKKNHTGILRNLIIRYCSFDNSFMLNFVVAQNIDIDTLIKRLLDAQIHLKSVYLSINNSPSDASFCENKTLIWGDKFCTEKIKDVQYKIGAFSFFQVNTSLIENMYDIAKNWLNSGEILIDLYCGVGGFGIYLANGFKKVIGIDNNSEAIQIANINSKDNNALNCEFYTGRVEDIFNSGLVSFDANVNMVIDPPRSGVGKKTILNILKILPPKIVYTSCNPLTLIEDLKILKEAYDIKDVKLLDMFVHTNHLESMLFLELKKEPNLNILSAVSHKQSCLNLLNIAEFSADQKGNILEANNSFFKFVKDLFMQEATIENLNIFAILKNPKISLSAKNIEYFFNENSGIMYLKIDFDNNEKPENYNLAFERTPDGFKGLISKNIHIIENILDDSIVDKFHEDIVIADENFVIEKTNKNFLRNLQLNLTEIANKKWFDVVKIRDSANFIKHLSDFFVHSEVWEGELIFTDKNNLVLYYYCTIIKTEILTNTKFLIIQKNITKNVYLEKEFLERTNQSNRLIREIDELISVVRNKEKSPLLNLKNFFIEQDSALTKAQCLDNLNFLEKRINNLRNSWFFNLTFDDFNMTNYNLLDIIYNIVNTFSDKLNAKNIDVQLEIVKFLEAVYLDKDLFAQMFSNIFDNAVKFSNNGSQILIKILKYNGFVKIHCIDSGPGIAPENLDKIFSKYVKIGDFKEQEGEGVGLALVRDIADVHSGRVWVESPPKNANSGSDFIIQIPIEKRSVIR